MDFKNSDIANGLDVTSLVSADASASLEGAALLKMALQSGNIMPLTADGQLVLPAGVGLDDIKVVGRDLVIQMPDGTQMIVPDGAIIVPQIVVDGVAIPALNFAALLAGQEPQPAAGLPQSSGGNFADNVGDIGDPFALGDLLPPTQLAFPQPEERELVPGLVDREPDVIIQDGGPAGRDVIDNVNETGLPGTRANGNVESPGSAAGNGSDSTTGTIFVTSPDGIASIAINGVVVTGAAGQQITTPLGVLTLSALNGDQIGYTYRLLDNTSGDTTTDAFLVSLTDPDGDVATARLTINIADDVPTARNDIDSLAGGTFGPELGNVLTGAGTISGLTGADTLGADGAAISGFRAGASGSFAAVGNNVAGQYGTLTLGANGSYSYVRNVNTPGGVADVFTYQLTDTDGDASTATLTINIGDASNRITFIPDIGDGTIVREPHLPARDSEPSGSQFDGNAEATSGTITFNSPDGVGNVTVAGAVLTPGALPQLVSSNATGSLLVTAYTYNPVTGIGSITYAYTLKDNTLNTNGESLSFPVVVTDLDGDVASDSLIIKIVDDAPLAANDSGTQQSENAPVSINVFVNDTPGADGINLATGVSVLAGSLTGAGALAYSNNGIFTYTPAPGEEGVVTFQYVITDGDGDTSTATVTISLLEDSLPSVEVNGENVVAEAGLPSGSDATSNSETTGGTIAIATGGDALASLVINNVNVTAGGTVSGASGILTVSVSEGVYSYSYTLTDNTSGDATTDSFNVIVTDSDGDSATDTLVIAIQDDVPSAADDADAIAAGTYGPVTGNVITDAEGDGGVDTQGADGAKVTTVMGSTAGAVGGTTAGTYGVLVLNADGSYIYTRNAGTEGGVSDVFTYTLIDGDGDIAIATLTISIADSPTTLDLPTAGEAGTLVDEAGLANGSDADSTNETTSGSIAFTAPDGPATVTLDGQAVTSVGQIFVGNFGLLTVTSIANGAIGYSYTLTTNTAGDTTFDDFAVVVTDQDGDATASTLVIDIIDDVPSARADVDSVTEDGPTVADGNVITGANVADVNNTDGVADTQGADGVSLTAFSFGANAGVVGSALAGAYGALTMDANGSYSYALNNDNAVVQGLDGDDSLTEIFTYNITDGDGDTATTTLTVTINGSDDPITINGLNVSGPDLIVDEDDLLDGSSPNTPALTQNGTFTVNGVDGIASIKIGGVETFVGQTITNAFGTFTITALSAPANGSATAITVGYRYVLTDNSAHANADNENFITEIFSVAVTDTDGSTDTDQVEVRIIDDVPTAVNDTDIIAAGSNLPAAGNVITDSENDGGEDTAGADAVLVTAITGAVAGTVGGSTAGTYGVLTMNANGGYSYTRNDGTPGNVQDVFTYTITDADGDTTTATLTINIADAAPVVGSNAVVLLDDDALAGGNPGGTGDDADAANVAGTLSGSGGDGALTFAYQLTGAPAGFSYVAGPSGSVLVQQGGTTVLTVTLNSASGAYTVTQNAPIAHAAGGDENNAPFTLSYTVTDVDGDAANGTLVVNVDDDTPVVTANGAVPTLTVDETVLATNASASFADIFTTSFGADGAGTTAYTLGVVAGPSGLVDTATGQAVNLLLNGSVVEGRTAVSNELVFTVTVNGSGTVTLDQQRAVVHAPNSGPDQSTTLSAANLITLTATSTDGDGDTASATANIANALTFKDDAPSIDFAASGTLLIVDESLGITGSIQNEGGRQNNDEMLIGAAPSAIGFATGSIVSLISGNAGADGEASRVYALTVNNATSGLLDSVTNSTIVLVAVNATTVEGRVGSNGGAVSFRIAIDPATGVSTINQFRAVEHNDGTNHDENGPSEAMMNAGALSLGVTLTDSDGDQSNDSVDVSQLFKFEDDGPAAIGESGTTNEILKDFNTAFVIDFSGSIDNTELNTQLVAVKAAINALFGSTGGNVSVKFVLFAADAMASTTFTTAAAANTYLDSVNPATGGTRPSGALGASTDFSAAITTLLANYAADETADNEVFFLSDGNPNENLGGSGQALNDTIRPLWNSFVNNNDINVTAIGVGNGINNSNLQQIDVDGVGTPILVANFDDLIDTLVALFTPTAITGDLDVNDDFGTDGGRILSITVPTAAANDPVYTWNGVTGAGSQITASNGGSVINGITSILVATEIGGQFGFNFATGQWSYTPPRNVPADRTEVFNYTIVDGDGDTATATLNVLVENNDLPATAAVTATLDDDGLTGGIAGGTGDLDANAGEAPASASEAIYNGMLNITAIDNPIAAISFAQLQGTTAAIGQETVTYSWNAVTNLLTASISASPAGRTGTLFTVQLNNPNSGSYTVTLVDNILHSNVAGENDASVALTYRVADTDGSTNTGVLNITFDDDTPVAISPAAAVVINGASAPVFGSLDIDSNVANNLGADGGSVQFSPTLNGLNSGLTSNFVPIIYTVVGNQLLGKAGATTIFTVTLNTATSQYSVDMDGKIDATAIIDFNNGLYNFVGGNNSWSEFIPLAESVGAPIDNNSKDLLLTPSVNGAPSSTINSTANTGGIGGGASVGATETFRVDFVTDLRGNPADGAGDYGTAGNRDHVFDGHYTVNGASALFKSSGGSSVKITAFDDPDGNNVVRDGVKDTINGMTIAYLGVSSGVIIPTTSSVNYTVNGRSFTVIQNADGSVTIGGVAGESGSSMQGTVIAVFTANGYNSVEYSYQSGDTFQIGDFGATTLTNNPVTFTIPVQVIDADGDVTALSNLSITANSTPPIALDLDGDGVEFLGITSGVTFDYHGDGSAESTAWVGSDDGLLALDRNGDGIVNDGSEIVFARDGLTDLQGLAADYDSNRDGVLDANDVDFAKFGVWQDANSNGVTDAGEYRSLSDAGIVSIGLVSDGIAYSAANGSVSVAGQSVYAKADGSTGIVADAAFATNGTTSVVSRSADQIRTSNATTSVIAAALVGLAIEENAAAMPDGNLDQLSALVSENPGIGHEVASLASTGGAPFVSDLAFELTHDFAQRPHDVASSLRPSEEADIARSFQDTPMAERSALLEDKADPVSDDQSNIAVAFGGGDQVMHSMLDIAAFSASAGAGENAALPLPIEDTLREAMPDLMVDRLIDTFTAALGAPANDVGGGANDSALLAGILSQGVDAFQLAALASNDLSGAHHYDMAMISNG
jgi:VCBS repeat-containing protein